MEQRRKKRDQGRTERERNELKCLKGDVSGKEIKEGKKKRDGRLEMEEQG